MNSLEVIGLGALNMDNLYRVERILNDSEAVSEDVIASPGGSAANTIYGLAKLGVNSGFIGVIGDDTEGKTLVRDFQKVGVETSQIRIKPGAKTGLVLCLSDKLGQRSLYVMPGANSLLTPDDFNINYINQARILHVSSFVNDRQFALLLELMDKLDTSVKVSFSPGMLYAAKGLKILAPILDRTHILFINQTEIRQLTGKDIADGAKTCLNQGCRIVVVTLGKGTKLEFGKPEGQKTVTAVAYIRDAQNEATVEPVAQSAISQADTTGAGDAFATGFLYGLLKRKGIDECGHLGNVVAQFSITKVGTRQGLPASDELSQRYQELHNKEL